jgi:hypothetical protein
MENNPKISSEAQVNLTNIFINSFSLTFLIILINFSLRFAIRSYYYSEIWDKSIYLFSILLGLYYFKILFVEKHFKIFRKNYNIALAFLGIILGLVVIENNGLWENTYPISDYLWSGFGYYHFFFTIIISLFVQRLYYWENLKLISKSLIYLLSFLSVTSLVLSFWQSTNSLIEVHHNEYVINDLLSIRAGNWPYENYISEYQNFFAFLTIPFNNLPLIEHINLALYIMFLLSIIGILLCVYLVNLSLKNLPLSVLTVLPLTLVAPFPIRRGDLGTIAAHLNAVSGRLFFGIIILSLTYMLLTSNLTVRKETFLSILIGFLSGLNLWSNQDFSIIIILTILTIYLVVKVGSGTSWFKNFLRILLGLSLGVSTLPIFYKLTGHSLNLSYVGYIAEAYINGHGSKRMLPGPVFLVLPLAISLTISNLYIVGISKFKKLKNENISNNGILGLLFSSWSVLGFVYYMNLSSASIQLQILLLPLSVALGSLIGTLKEIGFITDTNTLKKDNETSYGKYFTALFMSMLISIPIASTLVMSNPVTELERINRSKVEPKWPNKLVEKNIKHATAAIGYGKNNKESVGYFGYLGNYISIETGIESGILFNNPKEFMEFRYGTELTCDFLIKKNPTFLVVELTYGYTTDDGTSNQLILDIGQDPLCGIYKIFEINEIIDEGNFSGKLNR